MAVAKSKAKPKPKGKPGRPRSVEIAAGMRFGHLLILGMVHTKDGLRWRTECDCPAKTKEKVPTAYLTRKEGGKSHCGCQTNINANPYPREKGIWQMMHMRTEDPRHVSYHRYGGRGIKVCAEWNKANPSGWLNFIAFIGPAPSTRHSIDRVNPNLGYQPFQEDGKTRQVRWATACEQANNQERHWKGGVKVNG